MSLYREIGDNAGNISSTYIKHLGINKPKLTDRFKRLSKFSKVLVVLLAFLCSGLIGDDAVACWRGKQGFVRRVVHQVQHRRIQRAARRNARRGNTIILATPDSDFIPGIRPTNPNVSPLPPLPPLPPSFTVPSQIPKGAEVPEFPKDEGSDNPFDEPEVTPENPKPADPFEEPNPPRIPAPDSGKPFFPEAKSASPVKVIFVKVEFSQEEGRKFYKRITHPIWILPHMLAAQLKNDDSIASSE